MINNKQINIWRGDQTPPTIYHVWIKDNSKLLLYNGTEWVVFLDNKELIENVNNLLKATVNNKKIIDNPILDATDIDLKNSGNYTTKN
jgi:hypothetical protein